MVIVSDDGSIEVSVSTEANSDGKFRVSAKQLGGGNIRAFIDVIFGPEDNFARLDYQTQNQLKTWFVSGSHPGDVVREVKIRIALKA
jgi:hypothetical protein